MSNSKTAEEMLTMLRQRYAKILDKVKAPEPGSPEESFLLLKGYEPILVKHGPVQWALFDYGFDK